MLSNGTRKKLNGICGLFHPCARKTTLQNPKRIQTHKKISQLRVILIKCNKILGNIPWSIPCKQLLMLIYLILLNALRFELTKYIFLIVLVMFSLKVETTLYLNAKHHQRFWNVHLSQNSRAHEKIFTYFISSSFLFVLPFI